MRRKQEAVLCFESKDDGLPKVVRDYRARYRAISQVLDGNPEILSAVHKDLQALSEGDAMGREGDYTSENILRALVVQHDARALRQRELPAVDRLVAGEHAQQGRLAGAVAPRDRQAIAALELERNPTQERLPSHVLVQVGCDENGHGPMVGGGSGGAAPATRPPDPKHASRSDGLSSPSDASPRAGRRRGAASRRGSRSPAPLARPGRAPRSRGTCA